MPSMTTHDIIYKKFQDALSSGSNPEMQLSTWIGAGLIHVMRADMPVFKIAASDLQDLEVIHGSPVINIVAQGVLAEHFRTIH